MTMTRDSASSGDELEQKQRRGVGGVEVVENDQERLRRPRRPEEGGGRVEEPEPGVLRIGRGPCRHVRQHLADLGDDLRELGGARSELPTEGLWCLDADVGAQCLHPRPVGGRAARFPATAPHDPDPPLLGSSRQLVRQTALADPGLATKEEEPTAPTRRVVEPGQQLAQLAVSPDEDITGRTGCDVARTHVHRPIVPGGVPTRTLAWEGAADDVRSRAARTRASYLPLKK
jgi:hypothetical protein